MTLKECAMLRYSGTAAVRKMGYLMGSRHRYSASARVVPAKCTIPEYDESKQKKQA